MSTMPGQYVHNSDWASKGEPQWARIMPPQLESLTAITQKAIDTYLFSKQANGEMGGIGWWQSANGYTAIALHDLFSRSKQNYGVVTDALRRCEKSRPNFINEFNDDTLWWGLCCVHVYNMGNEIWFLEKAKATWNHVVKSRSVCKKGQCRFRNVDMHGGCFWTTKSGEEQINSITTGLFGELSVRLALLEPDRAQHDTAQSVLGSQSTYIEYARLATGWILRCRYNQGEMKVLDGILLKQQRAQDWTFTYTTGVTIGVCALLYEATREREYLTLACDMAQAAMREVDRWVESNGVLTEKGAFGRENHQPGENNDAVGFKAVLVRSLATLYTVVTSAKVVDTDTMSCADLIRSFINVNFDSQQERNTNGNGQYGPWWNGPFEMPTSHSQMAVLDVMAAVVLVNQPVR